MEGRLPTVYLDNAATTYPKPEVVYRAVQRFMRDIGGSPGRSSHGRAVEAGRTVYGARESLANLFNVPDPLRIAFTKNATEALNVAILGFLREGDHVVTSSMEHNSVMRPLEEARCAGISYSVAWCSPDGRLDPSSVEAELRPETRLVVLNHASNVTGTVLPVAEVAAMLAGRGIAILVDAAQTAGRLPVDVEACGIDLLAFTGHKELFGPHGTGGLYVREGIELRPIMCGGTGSHSSSLSQPRQMPDLLESGTLNAVGIAGLAAGVGFVAREGVEGIREHEVVLLRRALDGIEAIDGVRVLGPRAVEERVGILPVVFDEHEPPEVASVLEARHGIACRAGLHCSPMAHRTIGTLETGAVRFSFSYFNTAREVDHLLRAIEEFAKEKGARP